MCWKKANLYPPVARESLFPAIPYCTLEDFLLFNYQGFISIKGIA
jgi:hypothetical protein